MARLSERPSKLGCAFQLLTYGEALFRSGSATALQGQLHALVIFSYWLLLAWALSGLHGISKRLHPSSCATNTWKKAFVRA